MIRFIQLHASSVSPRMEAIAAARSALDQAGASLTAIQHFADKASVLSFEVPPAGIQDIIVALRRSGMDIEEDPLPALDLLVVDRHGDATGTLQILYRGNECERVDQVPAVPG